MHRDLKALSNHRRGSEHQIHCQTYRNSELCSVIIAPNNALYQLTESVKEFPALLLFD